MFPVVVRCFVSTVCALSVQPERSHLQGHRKRPYSLPSSLKDPRFLPLGIRTPSLRWSCTSHCCRVCDERHQLPHPRWPPWYQSGHAQSHWRKYLKPLTIHSSSLLRGEHKMRPFGASMSTSSKRNRAHTRNLLDRHSHVIVEHTLTGPIAVRLHPRRLPPPAQVPLPRPCIHVAPPGDDRRRARRRLPVQHERHRCVCPPAPIVATLPYRSLTRLPGLTELIAKAWHA